MSDMPERIWATTDFKWVRVPIGWDVMPEDPIEYIQNDIELILQAALEHLNRVYPPDIFDGSSGDPGPQIVNQARTSLAEIVKWMTRHD